MSGRRGLKIEQFTAVELAEQIRSGAVGAREVAESALARIEAQDGKVGAFLSVDRAGALAAAESVDQQRRSGAQLGALAGVPVAVKDNICIRGQAATCGSRMLQDYRPPYDAHVVDRLRAAGAVIVGKTNLDEFAMGSSTENSALRVTRNPRDLARVPGGSSGGSAAAVAAGFCPLSLGSDTGGSIRQPAAYCGILGMKPTYGVVSRYGLVAFGSSLDQIGPFARDAADAALLLSVIAGPDGRDSTCLPQLPQNLLDLPAQVAAATPDSLRGLRIGLPKEYFAGEGLDAGVRQKVMAAVDAMRAAGAVVKDVELPLSKYAIPVYYIIATAEASSNLSRYDGAHFGHATKNAGDIFELFSRSREEGFGEEVKRRIMLGTYVLSAGYYDAYYLKALKVRTRIAADFARAFEEVDVIAGPTSPDTAFIAGEKSGDPLAMYLSDIYTISVNLAGLPGVSLPCGCDGAGLPVGLQLIAPRLRDDLLLRTAAAYERLAGIRTEAAALA